MPRLLLLRHAESVWNAEGRWQGLADSPLSARGESQAHRAAAALGTRAHRFGITALASSDLQRARATAEAIAPALGLRRPLIVDAGLREYDVGRWSGLGRAQIEAEWPGAIDAWRQGRLAATPGGESRQGFVARITATVARLAATRPSDTFLVVTHGGVISALERSLGAEPRRLGHLAGRWVDAGPEGLTAQEEVVLLDPDHDRDAVPEEAFLLDTDGDSDAAPVGQPYRQQSSGQIHAL